jgi:hypothetical protein
VDKALRKLLIEVSAEKHSETAAPRYVDDLIAQFNGYSRRQTTYIPLFGLRLHTDSFEIGQVVLESMTDARVEELIGKMETNISTTRNSEEDKQQFVKINRELLMELRGLTCARFDAVAEPVRARERAEEESRRILDLLRYAVPTLYPKNYRVAVGLLGDVFSTRRVVPIHSPQNFNITVESIGPLAPLELSPQNVEVMEQLGVFDASAILKKPRKGLTDFEDALLRGIHWFADSQTQPELGNKLLSLMTCLETFFTPKDGNPIGTAIAEGVAILVTDGIENRRRVKQKIKDYYRMRSGISHGGRKAILESDLAVLERITQIVTEQMINRRSEFLTRQALLDWIEEQKLG